MDRWTVEFAPFYWYTSTEPKPEWRHDPDRHVSWYAVYRVGMRYAPREEALRHRLCPDHELVNGQKASPSWAVAETR
jgi:hypothetical protein